MKDGLDLPRATVRISNHFEGPNFVRGLAEQLASYTVLSATRAKLEFVGGFNDDITYVQILKGTGFGVAENGRFTGTVEGYKGYEKDTPENSWSFSNLNVPLDRLNHLVADFGVTFQDLLVIPLVYNFVGAEFDDIYIAGSFDDICRGYDGNDSFEGLTGDDRLVGDAGSDTLTGDDGADTLDGGDDDDALFGNDGGDSLSAGSGADLVNGGTDADWLRGGSGDDTLKGASGADTITGDGDDDLAMGGEGTDSIDGGRGNDTLRGDSGGDTVNGGSGDDLIAGGSGTNVLSGDRGNDTVAGDDGTDEIFGGTGNDVIAAGTGADFVIGGEGADTLSANTPATGAGDLATDSFIFEDAFGRDVVTDFEVGFDSIVLSVGIEPADVRTRVVGEDVVITVEAFGTQRITVLGVADAFDPALDIVFGN